MKHLKLFENFLTHGTIEELNQQLEMEIEDKEEIFDNIFAITNNNTDSSERKFWLEVVCSIKLPEPLTDPNLSDFYDHLGVLKIFNYKMT